MGTNPTELVLRRAGRSVHLMQLLPFWAIGRLVDAGLRRLLPGVLRSEPVEGTSEVVIERDEFVALAPKFVRHYAIHPVWPESELRWILDLAAMRTRNGPLRLSKVVDAKGAVIGCYAYYGTRGSIAHVLNILTFKNRENEVIKSLMAATESAGCVAARGPLQLFQWEWLCRSPGMYIHRNSFAWAMSKHQDAKDAISRNDIYMGGLAGEAWSLLIGDLM